MSVVGGTRKLLPSKWKTGLFVCKRLQKLPCVVLQEVNTSPHWTRSGRQPEDVESACNGPLLLWRYLVYVKINTAGCVCRLGMCCTSLNCTTATIAARVAAHCRNAPSAPVLQSASFNKSDTHALTFVSHQPVCFLCLALYFGHHDCEMQEKEKGLRCCTLLSE